LGFEPSVWFHRSGGTYGTVDFGWFHRFHRSGGTYGTVDFGWFHRFHRFHELGYSQTPQEIPSINEAEEDEEAEEAAPEKAEAAAENTDAPTKVEAAMPEKAEAAMPEKAPAAVDVPENAQEAPHKGANLTAKPTATLTPEEIGELLEHLGDRAPDTNMCQNYKTNWERFSVMSVLFDEKEQWKAACATLQKEKDEDKAAFEANQHSKRKIEEQGKELDAANKRIKELNDEYEKIKKDHIEQVQSRITELEYKKMQEELKKSEQKHQEDTELITWMFDKLSPEDKKLWQKKVKAMKRISRKDS